VIFLYIDNLIVFNSHRDTCLIYRYINTRFTGFIYDVHVGEYILLFNFHMANSTGVNRDYGV